AQLAVRRRTRLRPAGPGAAGAVAPLATLSARAGRAMKRSADLWRFPRARPVALLVLLFLYMPIGTMVVMSFSEGDSPTLGSGFWLRWYEVVLGKGDMLRAIRNSLMIATVATVAGTTVATMAALALARGSFRGMRPVQALLGLPLVVPEIVAAIALLLL